MILPEEGRVVVTGSVAFDYLMRFPGSFVEHLIPDQLRRLSVSFLVDEMRRVPGSPSAAWPVVSSPRCCAHRPLPSMTIAT